MANESTEGAGVTVVVLFNLRPQVPVAKYEHWARTTDLPIVRQLDSVGSFDILRTTGLFGGTGPAPYQYVEVLKLRSLEGLTQDIGTETMQRVVKEFGEFADQPLFMLCQPL